MLSKELINKINNELNRITEKQQNHTRMIEDLRKGKGKVICEYLLEERDKDRFDRIKDILTKVRTANEIMEDANLNYKFFALYNKLCRKMISEKTVIDLRYPILSNRRTDYYYYGEKYPDNNYVVLGQNGLCFQRGGTENYRNSHPIDIKDLHYMFYMMKKYHKELRAVLKSDPKRDRFDILHRACRSWTIFPRMEMLFIKRNLNVYYLQLDKFREYGIKDIELKKKNQLKIFQTPTGFTIELKNMRDSGYWADKFSIGLENMNKEEYDVNAYYILSQVPESVFNKIEKRADELMTGCEKNKKVFKKFEDEANPYLFAEIL